ncbi:MAG: anti-sigma factor [Acetobacteraceae bacterium]|nr:anti-sigma factor [Acetobacteraceae bacterium]
MRAPAWHFAGSGSATNPGRPHMACDRVRPLLPLLADGELSLTRRWMVSRHLARCPDCAAQLEDLQTMRTAMRTNLPFHQAPPDLAARIGNVLPREMPPVPIGRGSRLTLAGRTFAFAGSTFAGALAGVALTFLVMNGRADDAMTQAVLNSHVRSMMADHLTDVLTEDRHTVKPWLSARLDVSPPVPDLAPEGFPLVGGRLDYIDGHRAAAVVYRRDKHVINLFAWAAPNTADAGFRQEARQGFNLMTWRHDGVAYCAISDLEADQLQTFSRLVAGD